MSRFDKDHRNAIMCYLSKINESLIVMNIARLSWYLSQLCFEKKFDNVQNISRIII